MQRKTGFVLTTIGLLLIAGCCLVGATSYLSGGVESILDFLYRNENIARQIENLGTKPPDFDKAKSALPIQVGAYILDEESVLQVEDFYEFKVDDDACVGTYHGPDGKVELAIIRTRSSGGAQNYVKAKMGWINANTSGTKINVNQPDKTLIIHSVLDQHGQTWASQEWVISIEANSREARDDFFEALPYR